MVENINELQRLAKLQEKEVGSSEENVKQKLIVPLLTLLGHSREELDFEYRTRSGGRIDIFIKNVPKDRKVIIDTKNYSEDLGGECVEQIKTYTYDENALIAILANGSEIRIYSPLKGIAFEESLIYQIRRENIADEKVWQSISSILSKIALSSTGGVLDKLSEREKEIKDTMNKEEGLKKEYEEKIGTLQGEIDEMDDRIDKIKSEITDMGKDTERKAKLLWEEIGLPRELFKNQRKTIQTIDSVEEYERKAGRVYLQELVDGGFLRDGQRLYFYNTRLFNDEIAQVISISNKLKYFSDGKIYSISELARVLLIKHGFKKDQHGVAGPKYWKTEEGRLLDDLNDEVRKKRGGY